MIPVFLHKHKKNPRDFPWVLFFSPSIFLNHILQHRIAQQAQRPVSRVGLLRVPVGDCALLQAELSAEGCTGQAGQVTDLSAGVVNGEQPDGIQDATISKVAVWVVLLGSVGEGGDAGKGD